MQPNEPSIAKAGLPQLDRYGGGEDGELHSPVGDAVIQTIVTQDCPTGLHEVADGKVDHVQPKVLLQTSIEETDGEQVLYPRQAQSSELPQKLISEPRKESEKPPSYIKGVRTFVTKPLLGNERTIEAYRMRRRIGSRGPCSDPESYLRSGKTEWGRFEVSDRPSSASALASLRPLSPILSPQSPPPPPSSPLQTMLYPGRGAPNRSGTDPGMSMAMVSNPNVVPLVPPNRKKPPAAAVADASNKKTNYGLLDLTGRITRPNNYASAHGGFADVWAGYWHAESGTCKVAIKVLRSQLDNEQGQKRLNKKLRRELRVWQRLHHENVIPLLGVTSNFGPYTSMVCPWMENGTLNSYLENTGDTLRLTDRFRILREVSAGLAYLHLFDVIHGDLTGSNVLISDKGQAKLSDFGLSTIIAEFQGTSYFTTSIRGAVRWAAREIYNDNEADPPVLAVSTHSDVYSFGSVMLQTLSNKVPYHYLPNDAVVLLQLDKGVYPRRPLETWVTDDLWTFINRCWVQHPSSRPAIREVQAFIDFYYYANILPSR